MAKTSKTKGFEKLKDREQYLVAGRGGATHQTAKGDQGRTRPIRALVVADNQNTLKSGDRGPRCWKISPSVKRSPISTMSAFPSASSMRAARARMATSR